MSSLKNELSALDGKIARLSAERDYNEAQFNQLEAASLREGELAELEDEQKQLEDEVQKLTDKFVADVDKIVEAKTKEILTV